MPSDGSAYYEGCENEQPDWEPPNEPEDKEEEMRVSNKQALAFVYCENEPGRRTTGKLLTRDDGRRIAVNIAKLSALLLGKDTT